MPGVDLNYFMRQASKLTEKMEQRKKELAEESLEGQAGDGRVKVVVNGIQEVRTIKLNNNTGKVDVLIQIDEFLPEFVGQATANGCLAAAAKADQNEGHPTRLSALAASWPERDVVTLKS